MIDKICDYREYLPKFKREIDMTQTTAKTKEEKILDADIRASRYLGDANEAEERGEEAKAEKLYAKSGFWRDRFNKLSGNA